MSGQTSIRCAHGDIIKYPMAYVQIRVGAMEFTVKAGVSNISFIRNRCTSVERTTWGSTS